MTPTTTKTGKKPLEKNTAIIALILNIITIPGIGSLVGGETKEGLIQLIASIIAIPLMFVIIGIPIYFAMWIWGILTGVKLVKEAEN